MWWRGACGLAGSAVHRTGTGTRLLSTSQREVGVAVVGGSGYTGAELIRLLAGHPYARVRLSLQIRTGGHFTTPSAPS